LWQKRIDELEAMVALLQEEARQMRQALAVAEEMRQAAERRSADEQIKWAAARTGVEWEVLKPGGE
jgi:gamma-glutamyl:cysteine ligase YbdK (ATP-grasp superfamily)